MSKAVLDASAVIAVLRAEAGFENILPYLRGALISSVNVAEILCLSRSRGSKPEQDDYALKQMLLERVAFDNEQAHLVASIFTKTSGGNMGFADRACIALGLQHQLPVITGDREWLKYDVGVEIKLFR